MKKNLLLITGVFCWICSFGQGEIDAFRLSENDLSGTARGQAMGGAFGALGGDITGVAINPAGIGIYRTSEINGSLGLASTGIQTQWQKSPISKSDNMNLTFDNISYVGYYPMGDEVLQSLNFGFSYNKTNSFNRNYKANGRGMETSLIDYIKGITDGVRHESFSRGDDVYNDPNISWLSVLGADGGLINFVKNTRDEYSTIVEPGETVDSHLNVSEKGYMDSYDFTLGANLSNTLYLGATMSFKSIDYRMDSRYEEQFLGGNGFVLENYLQTTGSGYQINIGAIWRPIDFLRLGFAYHSPVWWELKDSYQGWLTPDGLEREYKDKNGNIIKEPIGQVHTPDNAFANYRFQSPYSCVFSIAGILGKKAIISLDYEIKDYRSMYLDDENETGSVYNNQNEAIDKHFRFTSTIRGGLEYRFTSRFSGRLGCALIQHPYEKSFKNNEIEVASIGTVPHYVIKGDAKYWTAGIGYRFTPNFYIDAAFVSRTQTDDVYFFPQMETNRPEGGEYTSYKPIPASSKNNTYKGLITFGYKF